MKAVTSPFNQGSRPTKEGCYVRLLTTKAWDSDWLFIGDLGVG